MDTNILYARADMENNMKLWKKLVLVYRHLIELLAK